MDRLKAAAIAAAAFMALASPSLAVTDAPEDRDATPSPVCDQMPAAAVISVMSTADAGRVCRAMGLLDGVRVKDIRTFSKAVVVLSHEGYAGSDEEIAQQLVEIVRLRGLYNKPDRWYPNVDIIVRAYQAFNGVVSPRDAIEFLAAAGKAGKTLSDDGFMTMMAVLLERKRQAGSE